MRAEVHREISFLMTQMRRLCLMAVNKRLALLGSSMHVYKVLFRLVHEDEVPQHELAFDAAMDRAAASRLIREMTDEGLVTTRVDPADKRQRFVKLTAKGRTLERTLSPVVDDALAPYMSGLSPSEEQEFLRLLRKAHDSVVAANRESEHECPGAAVKPREKSPPVRKKAARRPQIKAS